MGHRTPEEVFRKSFTTFAGLDSPSLAISEDCFYAEYDAALEDAGIQRMETRPMTPHCCHHTFVTMANDAGLNLAHVQKTAGHSDPTITAQYNHTHDAELVAEWRRLPEP